jgi:hypothetical protein
MSKKNNETATPVNPIDQYACNWPDAAIKLKDAAEMAASEVTVDLNSLLPENVQPILHWAPARDLSAWMARVMPSVKFANGGVEYPIGNVSTLEQAMAFGEGFKQGLEELRKAHADNPQVFIPNRVTVVFRQTVEQTNDLVVNHA